MPCNLKLLKPSRRRRRRLLSFGCENTRLGGSLVGRVLVKHAQNPAFDTWLQKPSTVECLPIVSILETRGPAVQGHPGLHSEFWASLGYLKPVWGEKKKELRD